MEKHKTMFRRRFVLERLPGEVSPADEHLQIFENYLRDTDLRLRSVRNPSTDERTRSLERIEKLGKFGTVLNSFPLKPEEYEAMRPLRGREIRKNRYELFRDATKYDIDVFLGPLWGLNIATAYFEDDAGAEALREPEMSELDVSEDSFFDGKDLCDRDFEAVRRRFLKAKGEG